MKVKYAIMAATMTGVLFLALAGAPKASAQGFSFTTIDVPNAAATVARGVANDGTVVGFYFDQTFTPHGSQQGRVTFVVAKKTASTSLRS